VSEADAPLKCREFSVSGAGLKRGHDRPASKNLECFSAVYGKDRRWGFPSQETDPGVKIGTDQISGWL
jgi:hypothetical protein